MKKGVLIIAEAGVNHNGDYSLAEKLVDAAADAGADFVKFQTFKTENIVSKAAKKAVYQEANIADGDATQFAMLKKLEMPQAWHHRLIGYAHGKNIGFLSTGFDEESVDFLDSLKLPLFKIPSGEITNRPLLQKIASKGSSVIISTGMATMAEIKAAVNVLLEAGLPKEKLTVLHCNTEYPTPMKDVNLHAMNAIRHELNVAVGYSDHTLGIEVPIAAVALGAQVIEKHFTLDRSLPGPDHKASLEPGELKSMVSAIRNIELAISGTGFKEPSPSELPNLVVARKSIHLKKAAPKGTTIQTSNLIMKRPGDGISPMDIAQVVGKVLNKDLDTDSKLTWNDLNG